MRTDYTPRRKFTMRRPTARRDRAIILTLLDTGLRASELCSLRIGDVDLKSGKVIVRHGVGGRSKGGKGRTVFMGKSTCRVVWRYLADRDDGSDLFTLKSLLGRSSLEMVEHYARIAEVDVEQAHRRASPGDNWRL